MHSSKQTDVFLSISSNPIIEDCNTIRFAQYPIPFRTALLDDQKESPPFTVQDFSHIRPTPSPHFSMMGDADKNDIEHWLGRARDDPTYTSELPKLLPQ
ncbi:hypothetical protein GALMADRAFT_569936 [Galerina marginata CBS 339.88]|uniref:Tubulin binding cofactor C-like domain-containing protein n=1 Tax=Galerina marginata (strain CBS 339.88) TaxID=685588 RepID=A0A067T4Y9_GALM3|nr:hypothetical protein GALMADRAFT_569936 [Galerina marginata CBS 339.88]